MPLYRLCSLILNDKLSILGMDEVNHEDNQKIIVRQAKISSSIGNIDCFTC